MVVVTYGELSKEQSQILRYHLGTARPDPKLMGATDRMLGSCDSHTEIRKLEAGNLNLNLKDPASSINLASGS
jgi:hypothetical protein